MTRILVVEDQRIIGKDIEQALYKLGYDVISVVQSGQEAILKADETIPDLVLMDILLKGNMSGIEAAQQIRKRLDIPIVYLTAYSDENTLKRAKLTEPYGYIVKPFSEGDLKVSIEISLYKSELEKKVKKGSKWVTSALNSMGDAVITVDMNSCITFMNPAAEELTAWKRKNALGKGLSDILRLIDRKTQRLSDIPVSGTLKNGTIISSSKEVLKLSNGREVMVSYTAFPIHENGGKIIGSVMQLREVENPNLNKAKTAVHDQGRRTMASAVVPTSVGIVSSSSLVREGLRRIVEAEDDIEILAEASTFFEMMSIITTKDLDVLLIDSSIPDLDMVKIQQSISEDTIDTKILLLLHTLDEEFIINAIYLGVQGYVKQTSIPAQLIDAIRSIKRDELWAERDVLAKVLRRLIGAKHDNLGLLTSSLTSREKEIVELIALGFSNKHISQKLSISTNTVKNHLANIFTKLGISKRLQLREKFKA
ncbi:MAG: response regulator [Thermodesulfobacteriota bacterium]